MGLRKYSPILAMMVFQKKKKKLCEQHLVSNFIAHKRESDYVKWKKAGHNVLSVYNYKTICWGQRTGNVQLRSDVCDGGRVRGDFFFPFSTFSAATLVLWQQQKIRYRSVKQLVNCLATPSPQNKEHHRRLPSLSKSIKNREIQLSVRGPRVSLSSGGLLIFTAVPRSSISKN